MSTYRHLSRRQFLKVTGLAGGGLLLGVALPEGGRLWAAEAEPAGGPFQPNAWVRIHPDNRIVCLVARSEMGQGVSTSLPMLIAEELEVALDQVQFEFAPADAAYVNRLIGQQLTGGSTSIRDAWTALREAGAVVRELLVAAAAQTWGVPASQCRAQSGAVVHAGGDRRLSYGELASAAAKLPVPEGVFLRDPGEFRLIGQRQKRLDTPAKLNATARFGLDVRLPGMLVASVARCPVFGGKARAWDGAAAASVKGTFGVKTVSAGVAVVAENTWAALKGREALKVEWDFAGNEAVNSDGIHMRFRAQADRKGVSVRKEGDLERGFTGAAKIVEAAYSVPFQAHACMEPMNCTADVRPDGCDLYVPTQAQTRAQQVAMRITGLPEAKVRVHTLFLGGGFGRRSEEDFVADAVELSKAMGRPVQVIWTREDDIQHDFYRPAAYNRLRGALDRNGIPVGWFHHIVGPSILSRVSPNGVKNGVDGTSTEGAANLPYAIPNLEVAYSLENTSVPVGFWRSVGSSQNAYVTECFLDELARAGGKDPFELRRTLLAKSPRHRVVLELAAGKAGWGETLPEGRHRGIAVAHSFGSYVAQVAEVSITPEKEVRVHRVVCAVDCGMVVNPDTIEAQMESAIVYGLTAALKGAITVDKGRVVQSNFHDYPLLRMDEMPAVEVHILKSTEPPGGIGEPGTPPIAPAVANAVFAATGRPVRSLPIRL